MRPGMTMQQDHRRPVAAVADTKCHLSNADKLDLEAVKETHADAFSRDPATPNTRPVALLLGVATLGRARRFDRVGHMFSCEHPVARL